MSTAGDDLREQVRLRYAESARAVTKGKQGSCGSGSCCADGASDAAKFGEALYGTKQRDELPRAAALASLGCGNPTAVAEISEGETVLDLGSGGGIDVILSAKRVGPTGLAYGLDMTDEMLALARQNARDAGIRNAIFLKGIIEQIPLPADSVDVVISNCVINLPTDKPAVLTEIARVLRSGGRMGVSDIVAESHLTREQRAKRGSYVGCIAGALSRDEYRSRSRSGRIRRCLRDLHARGRGRDARRRRQGGEDESPRGAGPAGCPGSFLRRVLLTVTAALQPAIRALGPQHWPEVARIYAEGIATGNATFETDVPTWEAWNVTHLPKHRFVALSGDRVVGWVAVAPVSERCVYGGVVENSVYVATSARGRGIGTLLLDELVGSTEAAGIWTIQTGIFPENTASIELHKHVGFEIVGRRKRLGKLRGEWRDVLLMERRSELVT